MKFLGSKITKIPTLKMEVKLNPPIACFNRLNWDIKTSNPSTWVHFLQKNKHFPPSNYTTRQNGMEFQIKLFQCLSKQFLQLRYKPTTNSSITEISPDQGENHPPLMELLPSKWNATDHSTCNLIIWRYKLRTVCLYHSNLFGIY